MRVDLGDTENEQAGKYKRGTEALLAALIENHDFNRVSKPAEYVKPVLPAVPLAPIPNFYIAAAADLAFPKFAFSGTIKTIQRISAAEFSPVTVMDINSQRRTAVVVRARQVAMYLAKEMTARSLPEIGRRFGSRDHTTVLHAVRKIRNLLETDANLAERVNRIKKTVEAAFEANAYC